MLHRINQIKLTKKKPRSGKREMLLRRRQLETFVNTDVRRFLASTKKNDKMVLIVVLELV